jgi:hypothetical protein
MMTILSTTHLGITLEVLGTEPVFRAKETPIPGLVLVQQMILVNEAGKRIMIHLSRELFMHSKEAGSSSLTSLLLST